MLYALLLLGLLPAAFLFDGARDDDDESDEDGGDDFSGVGGDNGTAAGEHPGDSVPDAGPTGDTGDTLTVPGDAEDTQISGFRPGVDSLNLMVSSADSGFYATEDSETGDATLHVEEQQGERVVCFKGLGEVPLQDITICVTDPVTGLVSHYALSLSGTGGLAMASEGEGLDENAGAIGPGDPEAEDSPTPGSDEDGPAIGPSDPEAPDMPTGDSGDEAPLDPVDTLEEELAQGRSGAVDELLGRDSDSFGSSGADSVVRYDGTSGDDMIEAAAAGDGQTAYLGGTPQLGGTPGLVDAGAGNDTVLSHGGSYVFGGDGDDSLTDDGAGSALYGGAGSDQIVAGPGGGHLDGGSGDDQLQGGAGDDVLEGGEHRGGPGGNDVIFGGAGNDVIRGGAGADILSGDEGDDIIDHAGRAEERLSQEERLFAWHVDGAIDYLDGGSGDDTLIFGAGDQVHGGLGADQFHLYSSTGAPAVIDDFASGQDFLRITLDPAQFTALPAYEVVPSEDGLDGLVKVEGVVVAVLQGAPGATIEDIYVELLPDIAA